MSIWYWLKGKKQKLNDKSVVSTESNLETSKEKEKSQVTDSDCSNGRPKRFGRHLSLRCYVSFETNEIAATYAIVVVESVINEKGMEIQKDDKPSRLLFVPACLVNLCQRH